MKIGIPRGLYFYVYYPLWYGFFTSLGHDVILSMPTNKEILNTGVSSAVDDICISVKVYHGHVKHLLGKKDVDHVFVPRIVSEDKYKYTCPKLAAMPDLIKSAFRKNEKKLLSVVMYMNQGKKALHEAFSEVGKKIGENDDRKIKKALKAGIELQDKATMCLRKEHNFLEVVSSIQNLDSLLEKPVKKERYTVALAGFPYDVYDGYMNGDVIKRLQDTNMRVVVTDMLEPKLYKHYTKYMIKDLFWHQANVAAKGGMYYMDSKDIDGVITISSFNCGISAVYEKLLDLYSKETGKPLMHIVVDEQTGDAGLVTRIEAFLDLIRVKRGDGLVAS